MKMKSTLAGLRAVLNPLKDLIALGILTLLSACALIHDTAVQEWSLHEHIEIEPKTSLVLELEHAQLTLLGSQNPILSIQAASQSGSREDLSITQQAGYLLLTHSDSGRTGRNPLSLHVVVPNNTSVDLTVQTGEVTIQDFEGSINVESRSADLRASNMVGELWVTTPRAAVTMENSNGEIHILGQAGPVHLSNLHGEIFVTTIMGEIHYEGRLGTGDQLKFETDHAGVRLRIAPDSDAELKLSSSGGQIVCSFPDLNTTGQECSSKIGSGAAQIEIRTVSGPIRVESWALAP